MSIVVPNTMDVEPFTSCRVKENYQLESESERIDWLEWPPGESGRCESSAEWGSRAIEGTRLVSLRVVVSMLDWRPEVPHLQMNAHVWKHHHTSWKQWSTSESLHHSRLGVTSNIDTLHCMVGSSPQESEGQQKPWKWNSWLWKLYRIHHQQSILVVPLLVVELQKIATWNHNQKGWSGWNDRWKIP